MVVVYARLIISYAHLESDAFTHYMVGHYVVIGFQIFPRGVEMDDDRVGTCLPTFLLDTY